jgi:hypothetical protein
MKLSAEKWVCGPDGSRKCAVRIGEARSCSGGSDMSVKRIAGKA